MAVTTTKTNKPLNPRGNDQSPLAFNRAKLYSGKALDFDGVNDYVAISYDASTRPTSEITLTAIAKMDWSSSTQTRILSCTEAGGYNISVGEGSFIPTGNTGMLLRLSSSGYTAVYISNTTIPDGYNAISSTFDGRYLKLYLNGTLVATTDSGETQSIYYAYNNSLFIGAEASSGATPAGSGYWNGEITGVKVFSTALTAAQVADLYNNPEKIVPTGVSNDALKLWLPMQEGAGTTAYDGSGNGNHGTISGATYTHGIGAPVSQTAVIDWNKGRNLLEQTNDIEGSIYWFKSGVTLTADQEDPVGGTDAVKVVTSNATNHQLFNKHTIGTACVLSVYVKTDEPAAYLAAYSNNFAVYFDLANETTSSVVGSGVSGDVETFGDWYRITAYFPAVSVEIQIGFLDAVYSGSSTGPWRISTAVGTTGYVAFPSLTSGTTKSPYIPNLTTSSMSVDVLLPAGLTTGRDITGVNLFENVRKQGALNLDGNSWAEVHDNASLDFGTGEFSLEAWVRAKYVNTGSAYNIVLSLGGNMSSAGSVGFFVSSSNKITSVYNNNNLDSVTVLNIGDWYHVVVNYNGTHNQIYINGAFDKNATRTAADITNALAKQIGRDTSTARYYKDCIAQPRIYNRALTAEEVQRNYNGGERTSTRIAKANN